MKSLRFGFAALVAALAFLAPASAEQARPLSGPPGPQNVKEEGATINVVGTYTIKFREGSGTLVITSRRPDGVLLGRYSGTSNGQSFDFVLSATGVVNEKTAYARIGADGSGFTMKLPKGSFENGYVTGNKLLAPFKSNTPDIKSGMATFVKQ